MLLSNIEKLYECDKATPQSVSGRCETFLAEEFPFCSRKRLAFLPSASVSAIGDSPGKSENRFGSRVRSLVRRVPCIRGRMHNFPWKITPSREIHAAMLDLAIAQRDLDLGRERPWRGAASTDGWTGRPNRALFAEVGRASRANARARSRI